MSSDRRILASRANGNRSHGPTSSEGKRRSSENAFRHGLLANCVVLRAESHESFQQLLDFHIERFGPVDGVEFGMLEEMAASYWRMRRAWAIETRLLEDVPNRANDRRTEMDRLADVFRSLAGAPGFDLIHRYETRLHRMYQRALQNLLLLRTNPYLQPPADESLQASETDSDPAPDSLPPGDSLAPGDDTPGLGPALSSPNSQNFQTNLVPKSDTAPPGSIRPGAPDVDRKRCPRSLRARTAPISSSA